MSKIQLSYFLILAFGHFTSNAAWNHSRYVCVDCRVPLKDCYIWGVGYRILETSLRTKTAYGNVTNEMNTCILAGVRIEDDFTIACVWSPQLGCQMVLDKDMDNPSCMYCRYDGERQICPCHDTPHPFKMTSGAGCLHGGFLQIPIGLYFVMDLA